jgi:hypothetical protein
MPRPSSAAAFSTCARADVASKTMSISSTSAMAIKPLTPSCVVATPMRLARARPSESGSTPTITATCKVGEVRRILIMRSVPMLPDPMMATFVAVMCPPMVRTSQ